MKLTKAEKQYLIKNNYTIKSNPDGLTKQEISILQKCYPNKTFEIREGIPFAIVFLVSFVIFMILYLFNITTSDIFSFFLSILAFINTNHIIFSSILLGIMICVYIKCKLH